jgi:hypothetical protein
MYAASRPARGASYEIRRSAALSPSRSVRSDHSSRVEEIACARLYARSRTHRADRGRGRAAMKFIRRLTRHGHSTHVSIPPQLLDYLRCRVGDMIVAVETAESFELRVRRALRLKISTASARPSASPRRSRGGALVTSPRSARIPRATARRDRRAGAPVAHDDGRRENARAGRVDARAGFISVLVVARVGERYEVVAGHRRRIAAGRAGLVAVPCCLCVQGRRDGSDPARENKHREDLNPADEAIWFAQLMERTPTKARTAWPRASASPAPTSRGCSRCCRVTRRSSPIWRPARSARASRSN